MIEYAPLIKTALDLLKAGKDAKDVLQSDKSVFEKHIVGFNNQVIEISKDYLDLLIRCRKSIREADSMADIDQIRREILLGRANMQSIRHQVISVFRMLEKDKSYDIFKEYFSSVLDMLTALHGVSLSELLFCLIERDIDSIVSNKNTIDLSIREIDRYINHIKARIPLVAESYSRLYVNYM